MTGPVPGSPGNRAVSTTVGYAMTLTITTLLVTGLLIAGGDFVSNQRDGAARNELRVLGQQLASDIAAADRLARTSGSDGDLTVSRSLPGTVTGATYAINVTRIGDRDTYELHLWSDAVDQSATVRVFSETPVFTRGNLTGGDLEVVYDSVTEQLAVRSPGPYVFQEEGGQVVIEAESFPTDEPGTDEFAAHYWRSFSDSAATGETALATLPNVSTSGGTNDSMSGPRLDYTIDLTASTTATYYVWVRMRAPPSTGPPAEAEPGNSDSIHVGVDGTLLSGGGQGLGGSPGWEWENSVDVSGDAVQFTYDPSTESSRKTLNIWMREDGTQVDKIVVTTDGSPPFAGTNNVGPPESEWR